tara:strand:+ start:90 stop:602 length:513 start_codon:yes stop_codon:yes gene_type:complete
MGIDRLNQAAGWLGRWALLLMIAIGAWNVVGRYLGLALGLSLSSNALIEAQWFLFDLAFLLGLGYALKRRAHVRIDIIASKQSPRRQLQLELLGTLGLLLPFALMVLLVSLQPTLQSWLLWEASPDPGGLPRYLAKSLIPLGFLLLTLQGLAEAVRLRRALRQQQPQREG